MDGKEYGGPQAPQTPRTPGALFAQGALPWGRSLPLVFFLLLYTLFPAGALPPPAPEEAPAELFSLTLGDTDVSLWLSGFWKGTFSAAFGLSKSPLGLAAASIESPFLFSQEADLSLSLWIRQRWFVEAGFLDNYALNTYRAGYQGQPGEAVQYLGLGNTGLNFPAFPYLNLGGDSPSSFGVYGRFGGGDLEFHGLVRYDAAIQEERVFVGNRERGYAYLSIDRPQRGLSFVLPDENIGETPAIYFEDSEGGIQGSDGRRWRRARSGEYAVSARSGMVELRQKPAGRAAAAYGPGKTPGGTGYHLGSYSASGSFLGAVQALFDPIALDRYPQPGQDPLAGAAANTPGAVELEGVSALVIYEPGTFSPFERLGRYRSPAGNSTEAALTRRSTGERLGDFEAVPVEQTEAPAFYEPPDAESGLQPGGLWSSLRGSVELQRTDRIADPRSPQERWPLAAICPEIYLPGSAGGVSDDLALRFTSYTAGGAGVYAIGTDAVPGSIQVFRHGLPDPNFSFNEAAGELSLRDPAGFNEVIRVRYLKKSGQRQFGSLAAGLGMFYDPPGPFTSGLAAGLRWNLSEDAYTEEGAASPGSAGLGAEAAWDADALKAKLSLGLGFEQPDAAGLYRLAGMEGSERTLVLNPATAFPAEPPADLPLDGGPLVSGLDAANRAPLVYRNYQNQNILDTSALLPIDSAAPVLPGKSGPYPALDPALSGETLLAAEFTLTGEQHWTGFQIPLGDAGDALERVQEIGVPFRLYGFERETDVRIIVQAGALADADQGWRDNPALTASWEIYSAEIQAGRAGGQVHYDEEGALKLSRISLNDADRRKLREARYMRILILRVASGDVSGRLLAAPPYLLGAGFRAITLRDGVISAAGAGAGQRPVAIAERRDLSLEAAYGERIGRLHPEDAPQRVLELEWKALEPGESAGADGRTGAIPLSEYKTLSFFFKADGADGADLAESGSPAPRLRFIAARGPRSLGAASEIALEAALPLPALTPGRWHKVDLRYAGVDGDGGVFVDGSAVSGAELRCRPEVFSLAESAAAVSGLDAGTETGLGASPKPGYIAVFIEPSGGAALPDGSFSLDEICLEEAVPAYRVNGGASLAWRRPGALFEVKGFTLLGDLAVDTSLESGARGDPFTQGASLSYGALNRSTVSMGLLGIKLTGTLAFALFPDTRPWNAGHRISRAWGPLTLAESFSLSPGDGTLDHRLSLEASGAVHGRLAANLAARDQRLERSWDMNFGVNTAPRRPLGFTLEAGARWAEPEERLGSLADYGAAWVASWAPLAPDNGADANSRDIRALVKLPLRRSPVGAELSAEGRSSFTRAAGALKAETRGRLDIPFTFGSFWGLVRGERFFSRTLRYGSLDALDDSRRYYESLADSWRLWLTAPVYGLFDPLLPETLRSALEESDAAGLTQYGQFSDGLSLSLEFPPAFGLPSLFLPQYAETRLARSLAKKLDTPADTLNIASALRFSSVNLFGAFGVLPVLRFYQSEELSRSMEAQLAIPRDDLLSWSARDEIRMSFYGFRGAALDLTSTFTIGSAGKPPVGWQERLNLDWTAPAPNSLLGNFYAWLGRLAADRSAWPALSRLASTEYERLRKETVEVRIQYGEKLRQSSITLGHESIVRIVGRLYFSVFAKLICGQDYISQVYSFAVQAGTTLNVSF